MAVDVAWWLLEQLRHDASERTITKFIYIYIYIYINVYIYIYRYIHGTSHSSHIGIYYTNIVQTLRTAGSEERRLQ